MESPNKETHSAKALSSIHRNQGHSTLFGISNKETIDTTDNTFFCSATDNTYQLKIRDRLKI